MDPFNLNADAGDRFHLRISGENKEPVSLDYRKIPLRETYNNLRSQPSELGQVLPVSLVGSFREATAQEGEPGPHNLWWHWTAPNDGLIRLAIPRWSSINLKIYRGQAEDPFDKLAALADWDLDRETPETVVRIAEGESYLICLHQSSQNGIGQFSLEPIPAQPGNHFFNRIDLGSGKTAEYRGSSAGMTMGLGDPEYLLNFDETIWFTWTCPETGPYTISEETYRGLGSDGFNVYTGDEVSELQLIARADEDDQPTFVRFPATAGTSYHLALLLDRPMEDYHLKIFPPHSYEDWLDREIRNPEWPFPIPVTARDRNDDRYGDGISNFERYAFGLPLSHPLFPTSGSLPAFTQTDGFLRLEYTLGWQASRATAIPIRHEGQVSLDGKTWTAITPTTLGNRKFVVETPVNGARKFLRLRVWEER